MEILLLDKLAKNGFKAHDIFLEITRLEEEFFPEYPYTVNDIELFHKRSSGHSLILIGNNKVCGYLIPILFDSKDYLQILTVAVDKESQKRGYGTSLFKHVKKQPENSN